MPRREQSSYTVARMLMRQRIDRMNNCKKHEFTQVWHAGAPLMECRHCGAPDPGSDDLDLTKETPDA